MLMENLINYNWILALIGLMWLLLMPTSFVTTIGNILKLIWHFTLFVLALALILILGIVNYTLVALKGKGYGYFLSTALSLDIWGNREFRTLWNVTLKTEDGYEFGLHGETISSVLGKNQRDGTLSKTGKILASFLDFIDKKHCFKSINNELNWPI